MGGMERVNRIWNHPAYQEALGKLKMCIRDRVCPVKPLRWVGDFYVQIFRNIPGATLLIMLVYALPYLNVVLSYYVCVLTATSLLPAAFCSEYLMAGMNTVSIGQIEAARALGMSFGKILKNVVIPQALRSSVQMCIRDRYCIRETPSPPMRQSAPFLRPTATPWRDLT